MVVSELGVAESGDQVQVLGAPSALLSSPFCSAPTKPSSPVGPQQHWTKPLGRPYGSD